MGGGGGRGGSAFSAAVGLVALGIGGVGGQGGDAGPVSVQNTGIIQTAGVQSPGMDAMSIGGGGGDGGAAMALAGNAQFTAAAAVGGKGGTGGVGNTVSAYNMHQILTFGSDSYGISAQSVGGGGGNGGATVALALQSVASEEIPSISLSASIGGSGGQGGTGNDVEVLNSGLLGTSGPGAFGVLAQSIGGGGGTGGDSSALQTAYNTPSINVAVAVGGNGGSGGDAGAVTVFNSGFLYTLNDGAAGIQAQSVGGGGGDGGYGRTNAGGFNSASGPSVTTTVAVGGYGGAGGNGGDVTIYNYANPTLLPPISLGMPGNATPNIYGAGGILTMGNSSDGVFAQSVGGGGGNGGNAIANGSGGNITVNVAIGGYGGAGGAGGSVLVDNGTGAILTKGANSAGIFAQSVGGGGGTGGSAATGSGADPQFALAQYIANGMGTGGNTQNVANNIWDWKDNVSGEFSTTDRLLQIAMGYEQANQGLVVPADSKPSVSDLTVDIGGGRAGKGGSAGNGGAVTVLSAGQITTEGALAAGIVAQSVGGGGGDGGAANPSTSNDKLASTIVSGSVAVGGDGGSSGDGGAVSVTNSGSIATAGDISAAILAQSIGGGGGVGGATAATAGAGSLMRISIGSVDGAWGAGGAVSVNNSGTINTGGESAYGVLAQSIGGGGGLRGRDGRPVQPHDRRLGQRAERAHAFGRSVVRRRQRRQQQRRHGDGERERRRHHHRRHECLGDRRTIDRRRRWHHRDRRQIQPDRRQRVRHPRHRIRQWRHRDGQRRCRDHPHQWRRRRGHPGAEPRDGRHHPGAGRHQCRDRAAACAIAQSVEQRRRGAGLGAFEHRHHRRLCPRHLCAVGGLRRRRRPDRWRWVHLRRRCPAVLPELRQRCGHRQCRLRRLCRGRWQPVMGRGDARQRQCQRAEQYGPERVRRRPGDCERRGRGGGLHRRLGPEQCLRERPGQRDRRQPDGERDRDRDLVRQHGPGCRSGLLGRRHQRLEPARRRLDAVGRRRRDAGAGRRRRSRSARHAHQQRHAECRRRRHDRDDHCDGHVRAGRLGRAAGGRQQRDGPGRTWWRCRAPRSSGDRSC